MEEKLRLLPILLGEETFNKVEEACTRRMELIHKVRMDVLRPEAKELFLQKEIEENKKEIQVLERKIISVITADWKKNWG